MSDFSSTKVSSSSSKKVSASSVSSSSKISSSSMSSDVDALLSKSAAARDTARSLASKLSTDLGDELDTLMGSTSIGSSSNTSSKMSSSSSSSKKLVSSSSLQSSFDGDGARSEVKSHSSSSATAASLSQKSKMVDGELVSAETKADRAAHKQEAGREKVTEGGQVVSDHGFNVEQTSAAKLRANKEMSGSELDSFFRQPAITGKSPEALEFDKKSNSFETRLCDLPEFSPKELTVKIVDGVISVVGFHEEVTEDGTTKSHNYIRRFTVPEGLKTDNVAWELEPSGVLQIKAGDNIKGLTSQVHLDCTIFKPRSFFKK